MKRPWKSWTRVNRVGFLMLILTVIFIAVEAQLITRDIENKQDSQVINLAGRQRMLSQRVANLAQQQKFSEAHKASLDLRQHHEFLLNGGGPYKLPPTDEPSLRLLFEDLSSNVETMKEKTKCLQEKTCDSHQESLKVLLAATEEFLPKMDNLVFKTTEHSESKNSWVSLLQFALIFVFCGLMVLSFMTVLLPQYKKQLHRSEILQEDKQRSEMMESAAQIGRWSWNPNTDETVWSPEVYRIHGVPEDTPTNRVNGIEFYAEHERPRVQKLLEAVLTKGKRADGQFEFYSQNGQKKWVRVIAEPAFDKDGQVEEVRGVFQDVSEQKLFENELIESKKQIEKNMQETQMILSGVQIGVWRFFPQDNFLDWDDSMYEVYGVDPNEFENHFDAWKKTLHPEDAEKSAKEFGDYMEGKIPEFDTRFRVITKAGEIRHIRARAQIFRSPVGNIEQVMGVNWDVTSEISAQEELEQQKSLSQRNAKLASIGVLAAGVGHEINNPLAIIKGYILTLKEKQRKQELTEEILESHFEKMNVAANRIATIVQGLRTFSRADEKIKKLFSTRRAIKETVEMVQEIYAKEGIKISLVGDSNKEFKSCGINAHKGSFQQILLNLLSNSKHALKDSENKSIEIQVAQKGDQQEILIRDYGTGLSDEVIEKIFDPFFTTKNVNEGTGIGLSLVHTMVEEMGGHIEARNHSAGGAEFLMSLPSEPLPSAASSTNSGTATPSAPGGRPFAGKKALLVDDEPELLQVLSTLLSLMGVQTKTVSSGTLALDALKKNPGRYDLVISDVKMPEMDGFELNRKFFSENQNSPDLPAWVFTTGGVNQDMSDLDSDLKVDGIFYKPFDKSDLEKILLQIFSGSEEKAAA